MGGRAFLTFILFFLVANPLTYKITRRAFSGIASTDGMPTQAGVLVHALVFVLLARFLMRRFSRYMPGTLAPGMLGGSGAPSSYMALAPHQHKQK
jgi:hypothetical protein